MEHFYCDKYGKDNVVIVKDSKMVEQSKLDPQKAYVQITYVEPYFDEFELRDRKTPFEQNFKLSKYQNFKCHKLMYYIYLGPNRVKVN